VQAVSTLTLIQEQTLGLEINSLQEQRVSYSYPEKNSSRERPMLEATRKRKAQNTTIKDKVKRPCERQLPETELRKRKRLSEILKRKKASIPLLSTSPCRLPCNFKCVLASDTGEVVNAEKQTHVFAK